MYCGKCGAEITDSDVFCPKCGNRIKKEPSLETYKSGGSSSNGTKSNLLKIIMIAGAVILAIVIAVLLKNKMSYETIDLNKYVTIEFDGYFNPGEPRLQVDTEGLGKEFLEKYRINKDTEKEDPQFYMMATSDYGERFCIDYLVYAIGTYTGVDFEKGSSEDEYIIKWTYLNDTPSVKEDILHRFYIELEYSDFTYKVPKNKGDIPTKEEKEPVKEEKESTKEVVVQEDKASVNLDQAKTALKSIDKSLRGFLWAELFENERQSLQNAGDSMDISLSDSEKTRAAVLACETDGKISNIFANKDGKVVIDKSAGTGPDGSGYHGESVDPKQVEENCINLFGTEANLDKLQTSEQNGFYDAVKYVDDTGTYAIILDAEVDTEHDQESHEYRVTESGSGFVGEVDMFFGYWGELQQDPNYSNYTVTYVLEPNNKSKYGVSVSSMSIKKISDNASESNQDTNNNISSEITQYKEPFYGVWCAASKDLNEAKKAANEIDGLIFVSSDWSNLNKEKWYVVTKAICEYEDKANAVLSSIQSQYPNAYIKYTGDYIGD